MDWLAKVWDLLNGWKAVLGYVIAQLPWFAAHPLIVEALMRVAANPDPTTKEGAEAWGNLFVQLLLLTGIVHIVTKNVKYGVLRNRQLTLSASRK